MSARVQSSESLNGVEGVCSLGRQVGWEASVLQQGLSTGWLECPPDMVGDFLQGPERAIHGSKAEAEIPWKSRIFTSAVFYWSHRSALIQCRRYNTRL